MSEKVKLIDSPIGMFKHKNTLVLKTEYCTEHNKNGQIIITPDCYIVSSGEYFWGGVDTVEERNNLMITPCNIALVRRGEWNKSNNIPIDGNYHCSCCGESIDICTGYETPLDRGFKFCFKCGADMRKELNEMNNDIYEERLKELAKIKKEEREYAESFPLSQFSTSQLKAELRRRKKEGIR